MGAEVGPLTHEKLSHPRGDQNQNSKSDEEIRIVSDHQDELV